MKRLWRGILLCCFFLYPPAGFSEEGGAFSEGAVSVKQSVDWSAGNLVLSMSVAREGSLNPKSRYDAEQIIEDSLERIFFRSVSGITLDSTRTIGERLREEPLLQGAFQEISREGFKDSASFSADLKAVESVYLFPLFGERGIVAPFVTHPKAFPLRRVLGFVPSHPFSGVVIFAKGEYLRYGTQEKAKAQRALFPRLFDEQMNPVLEKVMCDPVSLRQRGMVIYTSSLDLKQFSPRIGSFPLYIAAIGLFGQNNTDLILPKESVDRLLILEENRQLLIQGKILIITD